MVEDVVIEAGAAGVWDAVRDVGAVHQRLIPGYVLDTRVDGDVRYLTMPGGTVIRELIVSVDDELRRLAYSAVEGFKIPLTHHHASFQVLPEGPDRCRLVWTTDVLPHEMAEQVRLRVSRGAQVMKETLERSQPSQPDANPRHHGGREQHPPHESGDGRHYATS
ncbi:SRPBCC family protein [Kitasatospora sp. NPDC127059]|uniref:SRPBCC family protein n=1 Tax=Kitasatospora sp. NPDC127059 TaxID=3347120 RepID=UPI00364E9244